MAGGEETNEGKVGADVSAAVESGKVANGAEDDDRKVADLQLETVSRRVERIENELRALREQLSSLVARAC